MISENYGPDLTFAARFRIGSIVYEIRHNQIPGGSATGRRINAMEMLQEQLDYAFMGISNYSEVEFGVLNDWASDPDNPANGGTLPQYSDPYGITDDGTTAEVTVRDRGFIWNGAGNRQYLIGRTVWAKVTLEQENDPTLGGEDRYVLSFIRTVLQ